MRLGPRGINAADLREASTGLPCDPGDTGTETAEEPLDLGHAEAVGKFESSMMCSEAQELTWQS